MNVYFLKREKNDLWKWDGLFRENIFLSYYLWFLVFIYFKCVFLIILYWEDYGNMRKDLVLFSMYIIVILLI